MNSVHHCRHHLFLSLLLGLLGTASILPLRAEQTTVTYQGRVTADGANFNGQGQFKFALVISTNTSSQAVAFAQVAGGFVINCPIYYGGNGYTTPPAVTFSGGGGSGAAATATVAGGAVTAITVDNFGSGYTSRPDVIVAPPPANITNVTYWSNDGTSVNASEPDAAVSVDVNNGLFTVVLGDFNLPNMMAIDSSVFSQPNAQLRIWFNDGLHGFAALNPPQNLTPTPYAVVATSLAGVVENNVIAPGQNATVSGGRNNMSGGQFATVGGGDLNTNSAYAATVGGGEGNNCSGYYSTVGGGYGNTNSGWAATVAGGSGNSSTMFYSTVGGGYQNANSGFAGTLAGGYQNTNSGSYGTVSGGYHNRASKDFATISGGYGNLASASYATVAGGLSNIAAGSYSFAAGRNAQAMHQGCFVWSDSSTSTFSSTANDQFLVRANGGISLASAAGVTFAGNAQIGTSSVDYRHLQLGGGNSLGFLYGSYPVFSDGIHLSYNYYADTVGHAINPGGATSRVSVGYGTVVLAVSLSAGTGPYTERLIADATGVTVHGTFNNSSDRNAKQDFAPVNSSQILDRVLQLPLCEWSYKEDSATRHIGPMGQDFYSIFNVGTDEKHIAPIDEGGVALAAIQGLNAKIEEARKENASLKARLDALEENVRNQKSS